MIKNMFLSVVLVSCYVVYKGHPVVHNVVNSFARNFVEAINESIEHINNHYEANNAKQQ